MSTPDIPTEPSVSSRSPFAFSRTEMVVMIAVLVFYTATRLIGIVDFPIFFFCDEATQANLAEALVEKGFRDNEGHLFPPYFQNANTFNLSLSVWIMAPVVAAFGKTITIVRLTTGFIGLLGATALMLALKIGFKVRSWWLGGLVLAALPAWFLHSRTAFETVMMVGFYAAFILAYLLYREVSPRWLPLAVVFGGATFYSYSNGQGVMFLSAVLLLITDWRYHWNVLREHRRTVVIAILTAIVVASPYVRFRFFLHPEMMEIHLKDLHSYWLDDIPVSEKIGIYLKTYGRGLSPSYWFVEDSRELIRHRMWGYGYLPVWLAPVILLGLGVSIKNSWRSAPHRLVLIAVLAAPFSAAMVDIRITRVLAMMVPATILAVIGFDWILQRLQRARWIPDQAFAAVAAAGLVAASTAMTVDALRNGATWFDNYGLHGMQWGARQLYAELETRLESDPDLELVVSHAWANLPSAYTTFFLDPSVRHRVRMDVIGHYIFDYRPEALSEDQLFVVTPSEYRQASDHVMIDVSEPVHIISNPAGNPGFIFAKATYSETAGDFFAEERRKRREPVESIFVHEGAEVAVSHPRFDLGDIGSLFDGDTETIARTLDADPSTLVFRFTETRSVSGIRLSLWAPVFDLTILAETADGSTVEARSAIRGEARFATHELLLPEPVTDAQTITIVIDKFGDIKAHIQEIVFIP